MAKVEPIGIKRLESIHYYVHDLERSRRFYTEKMDFEELAVSDEKLVKEGKQRSALFQAGQCVVLVSEPVGDGGRAWRFLKKHPDGVGALVFEVEDIEKTFALLEERGGTPVNDIQRFEDAGGKLATFSITTPFGDTTFRFVQRDGYQDIYPGLVRHQKNVGGDNACGFGYFDHVTSNFQTMKPALLWMEHVLGFEQFWGVEFHTEDVATQPHEGSGLRSIVMWDPTSGVKFANNEPWRPHFKSSQINVFNEDHRGDGVQHLAIACEDLIETVKVLRERGVEFMPTPGNYYDALPGRLEKMGIGEIDEDIGVLSDLEILVDGEGESSYLLQIFLQDSAGLYREPEAGPFFYELIQRKGDQGFGAGNFRALFESIERQQKAEGRI